MITEAHNLFDWRVHAHNHGIDGLVLSLAAFCQARPDLGRMLAAHLREADGQQIGEWALACAAEMFSQNARDNDALLCSHEQRWTRISTGAVRIVIAWRRIVAWLSKDSDDEDTMEPAVMYLTGCIPQPQSVGETVSIGEAKSAMLAAAREGYYDGEEFAQRMMNTQECLDRIAAAIFKTMELFEIEAAAAPAKSAPRHSTL